MKFHKLSVTPLCQGQEPEHFQCSIPVLPAQGPVPGLLTWISFTCFKPPPLETFSYNLKPMCCVFVQQAMATVWPGTDWAQLCPRLVTPLPCSGFGLTQLKDGLGHVALPVPTCSPWLHSTVLSPRGGWAGHSRTVWAPVNASAWCVF